HITSLLSGWGWHVEKDRFKDKTPYGETEFTNIIATYNPSKPVKVILACHFDSKYFPKGNFVGATDSAVPCAIILETVRQLQCLLDKGPKDGSSRELILLDLIGTKDTRFVRQFSQTSELYKNLVKVETLLREKSLLVGDSKSRIFIDAGSFGGIEDDHIPFLRKGVDILHLISSPFPSVWHKFSDDWDHLDFDLIDNFSRIFRVFVANLLHLRPEESSCRKHHVEL
ncbi:hypothetical protein EGW08_010859, partial [Elysia chlorotica]